MKKKWLGIRIAFGLCAALGWWGLIYPELALTPDTVRIVEKDTDGTVRKKIPDWSFDGSLYRELMSADPDDITFCSGLFTDFISFFGGIHNGEE